MSTQLASLAPQPYLTRQQSSGGTIKYDPFEADFNLVDPRVPDARDLPNTIVHVASFISLSALYIYAYGFQSATHMSAPALKVPEGSWALLKSKIFGRYSYNQAVNHLTFSSTSP